PVIASHSNCRALVDTKRNLTDKQIKAIASKNGVIGMNAASVFTANNDKKATVESLIDHIDHIVKLVGVEYVGIGFDFCDRLRQYDPQRPSKFASRKPFDVLKGHKKINEFVQALIERGYQDKKIELILGKNFMRIYKEVLNPNKDT
ncbi:MAG: membrane dipeptidase, partial [Candidatus Aerophobetes bacterium]|nr:membrane dipeptidase [Candidatus Aerophobetes bacterium]